MKTKKIGKASGLKLVNVEFSGAGGKAKASGRVVGPGVADSPVRESDVPVSAGLADLIRKLDDGLVAEFGPDFAYGIAGGGGVVAASNAKEGVVVPVEKGVG